MGIDLKELYQLKAEELAEDMDFFTLPAEEQLRFYNKAMVCVHEALMAQAESRWGRLADERHYVGE